MCGIALLYGTNAKQCITNVLSRLSHRGPDDRHCWSSGELVIGFVRLAINDESVSGRQPYHSNGMVGAFNGEIYNADLLIKQYGLSLNNQCDTHVIVPLFFQLRHKILSKLDGFYSGVIYQPEADTVYLFRDHMGKKPLFYGRADNNLFVVSELKALTDIEWFEEVPLGISQLSLTTEKLTEITSHQPPAYSTYNLFTAMEQSVVKRLPEQPFGIFLSGGLDSSIIAALACKHRQDITYFTLGNADSVDVTMVKSLIEYLGLKRVNYISLPTEEKLPSLVEKVVYSTESYNPSIISNGLATYLLAQAAHRKGLKVVLTGEGADELFGGYHDQLSGQEWKTIRTNLINDMKFTELRRLDNSCMAHSIETRCPFLDPIVKQVSDKLNHEDFYSQGCNKVALRNTFGYLLPAEITNRKKVSFDVGSGIRKLIVCYLSRNGRSEIMELKVIWEGIFEHDANSSYFHSYPTFDAAIAKRGNIHK